MEGAFAVLVLIAVFGFGWVLSASQIAHECDRQGGFYVGEKDFVCHEAKKAGGGK